MYSYIAVASSCGIIKGYEDNSVKAETAITREDFATMINRALLAVGKELNQKEELNVFADCDDISDYAKDSVSKMKYFGIINGVGENMFAPKNNATRAETAKIIYGLSEVVGLWEQWKNQYLY